MLKKISLNVCFLFNQPNVGEAIKKKKGPKVQGVKAIWKLLKTKRFGRRVDLQGTNIARGGSCLLQEVE